MGVNREGHCFQLALDCFLDKETDSGWLLVHGAPLGTNGEAKGLRYPHGWLENGSVVWDPLTDTLYPKEMYYGVGNIESVTHYNHEEVSVEMIYHCHYGPWPDALVALEKELDKL